MALTLRPFARVDYVGDAQVLKVSWRGVTELHKLSFSHSRKKRRMMLAKHIALDDYAPWDAVVALRCSSCFPGIDVDAVRDHVIEALLPRVPVEDLALPSAPAPLACPLGGEVHPPAACAR